MSLIINTFIKILLFLETIFFGLFIIYNELTHRLFRIFDIQVLISSIFLMWTWHLIALSTRRLRAPNGALTRFTVRSSLSV